MDDLLGRLPRKRVGFYPTPFHKLENLSARYGVHFFMKREDLAGPGAVSGSKTRLAEFIIGQALEDGIDTIITQGAYLTNSGMQFAVACRASGIIPILYLHDESYRGIPREYRGNLLLNKIMNVEVHYLPSTKGEHWDTEEAREGVAAAMAARKEHLEERGHRVLIVPSGGAHPSGFVAHMLTFREMVDQVQSAGVALDYIYSHRRHRHRAPRLARRQDRVR